MSNIISGVIAISLLAVFLVFYAIKLQSIALWFIIFANLACAVGDFVQSLREEKKNTAA